MQKSPKEFQGDYSLTEKTDRRNKGYEGLTDDEATNRIVNRVKFNKGEIPERRKQVKMSAKGEKGVDYDTIDYFRVWGGRVSDEKEAIKETWAILTSADDLSIKENWKSTQTKLKRKFGKKWDALEAPEGKKKDSYFRYYIGSQYLTGEDAFYCGWARTLIKKVRTAYGDSADSKGVPYYPNPLAVEKNEKLVRTPQQILDFLDL